MARVVPVSNSRLDANESKYASSYPLFTTSVMSYKNLVWQGGLLVGLISASFPSVYHLNFIMPSIHWPFPCATKALLSFGILEESICLLNHLKSSSLCTLSNSGMMCNARSTLWRSHLNEMARLSSSSLESIQVERMPINAKSAKESSRQMPGCPRGSTPSSGRGRSRILFLVGDSGGVGSGPGQMSFRSGPEVVMVWEGAAAIDRVRYSRACPIGAGELAPLSWRVSRLHFILTPIEAC